MNAAGTRVAAIAEKNRIVAWKRISAEEASKVLVQAIVAGDAALAETVMAQPDELTALGIPATEIERAEKAARGPSPGPGRPARRAWPAGTRRRSGSASTPPCRT